MNIRVQGAPGSRQKRVKVSRLQPKALLVALVMVLGMLFAAAGCAVIPVTGVVGKSAPLTSKNNPPNVSLQQFGPEKNASAEEIIRGFIETGTGFSEDFQTARQFLSAPLAQSWSPDEHTLVFKNSYSITAGAEKNSYKVKFDVVSTIDDKGVLTPGGTDGTVTVDMSLVQVDGQWRIDKVPDGIVLAEGNFQVLFHAVSLYFFDPSFTYGVPDVRWLAGRTSRTATAIVRAVLAGPAPYLKGAVASAFPSGIALERDSVPVINGIAKVGLTAQPLLDTSVRQRQQMHEQLLVTLQKALNTVSELQFLADDRDVDMGGPTDSVPPMVVDKAVPSVQVALAKNELVTFDGSKASPIPNMASIANLDPSAPAMSYSGKNFAFLARQGGDLYQVQAGQAPVLAATGTSLTPPSFAPNGWLWTADGTGAGVVLAVNVGAKGATPVVLTVPWLVGQNVTTLRISRDGTRVLVIFSSNGVSHVGISGIVRSGDAVKDLTVPIMLTESGTASLGVWVGETSVAVVEPSATKPSSIEILDLVREPVLLSELNGVQWLSAGSGVHNVHAQTANEIYTNMGNSWDVSAKELHQASFAG